MCCFLLNSEDCTYQPLLVSSQPILDFLQPWLLFPLSLVFLEANGSSAKPALCLMAAIFFSDKQTSGPIATLVVLSCLYIWSDGCCYLFADFEMCLLQLFCPLGLIAAVFFSADPTLGHRIKQVEIHYQLFPPLNPTVL